MRSDMEAPRWDAGAHAYQNWTTVRCTNCGRWIKVPMETAINGAATCSWCGLPTDVEERKGGPLADTV